MKNIKVIGLVPFLIFISQFVIAQQIAVTERGDTVYLYSNGTWDYYENHINENLDSQEIRMNNNYFTKSKFSTKKINGSGDAYEIWYNDIIWKRLPVGELNPEADVALKLLKGDVYAMLIYEELEISMENLSQLALNNAINIATDIKMIDQEYRVVNNDTLIWMRMDGTTQGMKISYYSYYFSNNKGSIQFHAFTGQSLIDKYKDEIENLLNGLIIKE